MPSTKRTARPPLGYDVAGWAAVLELVGLTRHAIDRARLRSDDPPPVYLYLGRPVAKRADVEAWKARELRRPPQPPRARSTPPRPLRVVDVEAMEPAALEALAARLDAVRARG